MSWECRYCDRPAGYMGIPIKVGDEEICACGAEWEDAKIWVEYSDEEFDSLLYDEYPYEEDLEIETDTYDCGCRRDDGCYCDLYNEEDGDDLVEKLC